MPERWHTARTYAVVLFSDEGAKRLITSATVLQWYFDERYVRTMINAARMPQRGCSNCSNTLSVEGVTLPFQLFADFFMLSGFLLRRPRGNVCAMSCKFVVDTQDSSAQS